MFLTDPVVVKEHFKILFMEDDAPLGLIKLLTEAGTLVCALQNIRGGHTDWALELLEFSLDITVSELGSILEKLSKTDQTIVIETLRSVRDYRARHPRSATVNKVPVNPKSLAARSEYREKAHRILDRIDLK